MKYKQKAISKITIIVLMLCSATTISAQSIDDLLNKADSLYANKQYTQSIQLYEELLSQHVYSESMLLKMAYVKEGLGQLSESLYYLNLYYLASDDEQALVKMEEIGRKHRLYGYDSSQAKTLFFILRKNYGVIAQVLIGSLIFLLILLTYQKKRKRSPMPVAISILILTGLLFLHINFSQQTNTGIIHSNGTYLMSGPSAGSSVVSIIKEGHLIEIVDKRDIWIHAKWMNQDVYVKKDRVLLIEL